MSLNWREINLILNELDMEGSHVQKIRQPDYKTLVLDLYKPENRFSLLISLNQGKVRMHKLTRKLKNKIPLQRFAQLLRSRIGGGRITRAEQIGNDRIVLIRVERTGETTDLYLRLWGGSPNIIAVDSRGIIIDAFYRRPARGEVSGKPYIPPAHKKKTGKDNKEDSFGIRPYTGSSFNSFIENFYFSEEDSIRLRDLQRKADRILSAAETQLSSSIESVEERILNEENFEQYREQAELIKANLYRAEAGMTELEADNYFKGNEKIIIKLDKGLSPMENAEKLFGKYRKAKRSLENLKGELDNLRLRLKKVKEERKELLEDTEDTEESIRRLERYLKEVKGSSREKTDSGIPGLQFESGGFTILVGRTASENDTILRKHVRGNDYWLHTRDFPGGYVFIKYKRGKSVPLDTLLDAGNLALFFSKGRNNGKGELYYTQVKHLRRARDGKKGLVLPTHEKNLSITLDTKRLNRLLGREEYNEKK